MLHGNLEYNIVQVSPFGVKIYVGGEISIEKNVFLHQLRNCIYSDFAGEVEDVIVSYLSLYVRFKSVPDLDALHHLVHESFVLEETLNREVFLKFIPVCYEEPFSMDINDVIGYTGLSREDIIRIHSEKIYYVYFLGFLPGFPYLAGLDNRLHVPRRATPRTLLPEGSVGIGGAQTGIYPVDSPGGWNIIGRTPLKLFDPESPDPFLVKAGECIKFFPIDRKEFDRIFEKHRSYVKVDKVNLFEVLEQ